MGGLLFIISFTLSRGLLYSDLLDSFLTRRGYAVPAWPQADLTDDLQFNYVDGFAYLTQRSISVALVANIATLVDGAEY